MSVGAASRGPGAETAHYGAQESGSGRAWVPSMAPATCGSASKDLLASLRRMKLARTRAAALCWPGIALQDLVASMNAMTKEAGEQAC